MTAIAAIALPGQAHAALYSQAELAASSSYGAFSVFSGGLPESRPAPSGESIALDAVVYRYRNGVETVAPADMKFTVSFTCGLYGNGSQGGYSIGPVSGHFTWTNQETLCSNGALDTATLIGYAYDPQHTRNPTPQLRIDVYGQRWADGPAPWTPW